MLFTLSAGTLLTAQGNEEMTKSSSKKASVKVEEEKQRRKGKKKSRYSPFKSDLCKTWSSRIEFVGTAVSEKGYHIWGSSPIIGPSGKTHLFVARWPVEKKFAAWTTDCEIARYVSDLPEGPYSFKEVILKGNDMKTWDRTSPHNPHIKKIGDKYALLYIARIEDNASQRIGMMISDSPEGPWRRAGKDGLILAPSEDASIWSYKSTVGVNNPTLLHHKDGRFFLYFKARRSGDIRRMGVAVSDRLEGPYVQHPEPLTKNEATIEDAYAFIENGKIHLLTTDNHTRAGLLWSSEDGIKFSDKPKLGYGRIDSYIPIDKVNEGTRFRGGRLERPQLLMQNGKPTHLFVASGGNVNEGADGACSYIFRIKKDTGVKPQ